MIQELIAKNGKQFEIGCKLLYNLGIDFEFKLTEEKGPKLYFHMIVDLPEEVFIDLEHKYLIQIH